MTRKLLRLQPFIQMSIFSVPMVFILIALRAAAEEFKDNVFLEDITDNAILAIIISFEIFGSIFFHWYYKKTRRINLLEGKNGFERYVFLTIVWMSTTWFFYSVLYLVGSAIATL